MSNVIDLEDHRKRKIARLQAERDDLKQRSDELAREGKTVAANALKDKAKIIQAQLDKLVKPAVVPVFAPFGVAPNRNLSTDKYRRGIQIPVEHIDITLIPHTGIDGNVSFISTIDTTDDPTKKG